MKKQIIFILLAITVSGYQVLAQQNKLDLAQKKYDELAYSESIKIYDALAKDGYKSKE